MKKVNVKKLNQYFKSDSNSGKMKDFVRIAVQMYMYESDATNSTTLVKVIAFLNDLGLLIEE